MKTKQDFPSINERPPEGVRVDGTKIRVLIVDDSIFVAKQLGQILTSEGYEEIKDKLPDSDEGMNSILDANNNLIDTQIEE